VTGLLYAAHQVAVVVLIVAPLAVLFGALIAFPRNGEPR
jgi:hypothetical protein